MDGTLIASAWLMGLAGGPHCAAMCGAVHGGIASRAGSASASRALWALQMGRLVSYSLAGALAAGSVSWAASLGAAAPLLRPIWTMLHAGALALGLWLLWAGRAPAWLAPTESRSVAASGPQPLRYFSRIPGASRAGLVGMCWALMPCGLLQSALIVAALASGPLQGGAVMAGFAASSAVSLWLVPRLWLRYGPKGARLREPQWPVRLAGLLLVAASGFALMHRLNPAFAQALCLPGG